jgi:hypothetical protein
MMISSAVRLIALLLSLTVFGCTGGGGDGDGGGPSGIQTAAVTLEAPVLAFQQQSNWCWAATIANLFSFHGHPVSQASVVAAVYGGIANVRSGDPANMTQILNSASLRDDRGVGFSSTLNGLYDGLHGVYALTNDDIRDSLMQNRPLVACTVQHCMLLVSMTYTEVGDHVAQVIAVGVWDPWPANGGFRNLTASEATPYNQGGQLFYVAEAIVN